MGAPPLSPAAATVRVTVPSPATAPEIVGAPGTVRGVAVTGVEPSDSPLALIAMTVKVYGTPLVRPVTVTSPAAATGVRTPPGEVMTRSR